MICLCLYPGMVFASLWSSLPVRTVRPLSASPSVTCSSALYPLLWPTLAGKQHHAIFVYGIFCRAGSCVKSTTLCRLQTIKCSSSITILASTPAATSQH